MIEITILSISIVNLIMLVLILIERKHLKELLKEFRRYVFTVQVQKDMELKIPNPFFHKEEFDQVIKSIYQGFLKNRNYEYIEQNLTSGYNVSPKPGVNLIVPNPDSEKQLFDWFITELFFGRVPK